MSESKGHPPFREFVQTARPLVVEGYYYDFQHFPVDVPGFVRHIKGTGANLVRLGTLMGDFAAYPSRYVETCPGIEGRDWVGEMMAECRRAGLRVINYVVLGTAWQRGGEATRTVLPKGIPWYSARPGPCLSGEAVDWTIAAFREVIERYRPEALYFDGGTVVPLCRCRRCLRDFRRDTGGAIPRTIDLAGRWMMPYIEWLNSRRAAVFAKVVAACREIAPDLYVIANLGDWKNLLVHARGDLDRKILASGVDTLHYENRSPATSSYVLEATKFGGAIGRQVWAHLLDVPPANLFARLPAREIILKGAKILAGGGTPEAYCHGSTLFQEGDNAGLRTVFGFIAKNEAVLAGRRVVGDSALLYSEASAVHALHLAPTTADNHILTDRHYDGVFRALTRRGIPFAVIDEQTIERDLAGGRYKTLYLASSFCLSPRTCRAIRAFVKRGGNLVATFQATLGRGPLAAGANLALADVFGVKYVKTAPLGGGRLIRTRKALRFGDSLAGTIACGGDAAVVRPTTGTVIADLCTHVFRGPLGMSLDGAEDGPAVTLNRFGHGRAVYIAVPLELTEDHAAEGLFWYTDDRYSYNTLSLILRDIDRLLNARPGTAPPRDGIRLHDPNMKAELGLFDTPAGTLAIVYETGTLTGEILYGASDRRKIVLSLPPGQFRAARSLRTGRKLAIRRAAAGERPSDQAGQPSRAAGRSAGQPGAAPRDEVALGRLDIFDAVLLT